ncbi:MAG: spiro-SPASM protein [Treponema sp.]|nr:spiro-SPASM protein [Candidatus Treponema equifaecale]
MENTVILFAAQLSDFAFEKAFDSKSAFDLVLEWAAKVPDCKNLSVFVSEENKDRLEKALSECAAQIAKSAKIVSKNDWTRGDFAAEVSAVLSKNNSDYGVISFADTPFLNTALTNELIETHTKYSAEYTFADGYPYGVCPEVIDRGAAGIISALCTSAQKNVADKPMSRDGLFSIMSGDINSFEIETVIADKDYRLLRLEFESSSKINHLACKNLYEELGENKANPGEINLLELCDTASKLPSVLKTVPAFYNVQISGKYNHKLCYEPELSVSADMEFASFAKVVAQIAETSKKAVVSLSCFGEPLLHPKFVEFAKEVLKYDGLSLLIETDGTLLTEQIACELCETGKNRIDWIVLLDAMDKTLYSKIHGCEECEFDRALNSIVLLEKYFEGRVYPQLVRMKINEPSLESFYRFWKEKENPSKGQFIIQKYNSFCGLLSDEKSADLSPLDRNPCWHLRRDMVILADGSVPMCLQCFKNPLGNVFEEGLEAVWAKLNENLQNHINKNYSECCGICDEHYTFNF